MAYFHMASKYFNQEFSHYSPDITYQHAQPFLRHHFNLTNNITPWVWKLLWEEMGLRDNTEDWSCVLKLTQVAWPLDIEALFRELPTKMDSKV